MAITTTFYANISDAGMCRELYSRQVRTIAELFQLADKCARVREGD